MSIECYVDRCAFHASNNSDQDGPYCHEKECRTKDMVCMCGNKQLITKIVEEMICFDGRTIDVYCPVCRMTWYDDTILREDER